MPKDILPPDMRRVPLPTVSTRRVRVGFIGTGGRGRGLMRDFLATNRAEIVAVADSDENATQRAQTLCRDHKIAPCDPRPFVGTDAWQTLLQTTSPSLDLVVIASPWRLHAAQAVAAMEAGVHVAIEVPAAVTLDECWRLVNTSEKNAKALHSARKLLLRRRRTLIHRACAGGRFGRFDTRRGRLHPRFARHSDGG